MAAPEVFGAWSLLLNLTRDRAPVFDAEGRIRDPEVAFDAEFKNAEFRNAALTTGIGLLK